MALLTHYSMGTSEHLDFEIVKMGVREIRSKATSTETMKNFCI